MSIVAVVVAVATWLAYANRNHPNVTFHGPPALVTGVVTVICAAVFIMGIKGNLTPEMLVEWQGKADAATGYYSAVKYLGLLALLAVGVIALVVAGIKNVLWGTLGLGLVVALVVLYFRFGLEITTGGG